MKVVIDANVLISAFISRGSVCDLIIEMVLLKHSLVLSEYILNEYYRKLIGKIGIPEAVARDEVAYYRDESGAIVIEPGAVPATACRDRNDLPILGTALAAGAEVIISGDGDLQTLENYQGIRICSPRAFLEWTRQSSN